MKNTPEIFFERLERVQRNFGEIFLGHEKEMGIDIFPDEILKNLHSTDFSEMRRHYGARVSYVMDRSELFQRPVDRQIIMNISQCLRIMNSNLSELGEKIRNTTKFFDRFMLTLSLQKELGVVEIKGKRYYWLSEEELQDVFGGSEEVVDHFMDNYEGYVYVDKDAGLRFFHPSILTDNIGWLPYNIIRSRYHVGESTIRKIVTELGGERRVCKRVNIHSGESQLFSPHFIIHLEKHLAARPKGPENAIGISTIYIRYKKLSTAKVMKLIPEYSARFPGEISVGVSRNGKQTILISKRVVDVMIQEQIDDKKPPEGWKTALEISRIFNSTRITTEATLRSIIGNYPDETKRALSRNGGLVSYYSPRIVELLEKEYLANGTYG